jgi:hypothetical protein
MPCLCPGTPPHSCWWQDPKVAAQVSPWTVCCVSPVHAYNIGLVRNLQTGCISPRYHLVYDDWFDTVYAPEDSPPPDWDQLCIFQTFETVFEEGIPPPTLADESLTPIRDSHWIGYAQKVCW